MDRMAFTLCAGGGAANLSLLCRLLDTQPSLASCTDEAGNWLLHVAAANGHADVCASLISREEGRRLVESVNAQGKTPLDVAADDVVRSLLSPPGSANPATASAEGAVEGAAEGDANEDADVIMSLSTLPEDLGIAILLQLDGAYPLLKFRQTSRRMARLAETETLWERLCWTDHKVARSAVLAGAWRLKYMEHQMLQAGAKANSSSFEAREERYLDRRERAGLCRVSRMVVEGTIYDVN